MILSHHARSATGTTIGKHNGKWETSMKWPLRHLYKMLRKASWGTIKVFFFTFHFSLLFPVLFPRCASLLYSPLHYPVVGSKSSSQSLKKWWLRTCAHLQKLDDGWPESEKDVFQAALRMVVVKDSRWIVGEFYMSYGKIWCEKVRLIKKRIFGKGHQMTCVLQPQRERGGRDKERERERDRERERERESKRERERMKGGGRKKT